MAKSIEMSTYQDWSARTVYDVLCNVAIIIFACNEVLEQRKYFNRKNELEKNVKQRTLQCQNTAYIYGMRCYVCQDDELVIISEQV